MSCSMRRVMLPPWSAEQRKRCRRTSDVSSTRLCVQIPIELDGARILEAQAREVFSAYVPSPRGPVFMGLIEKAFGSEVTTRTWETVKKCARACNPNQASIYARHYNQNSRRDGTLRWSFSEGSGFFLCRQKSRSLEDWDERHQDATPLGALPGARPCRR